MYLILFISVCLLVLTVLSICAKLLPELEASVLPYGKLNLHQGRKPTTVWATSLSKLVVPKHCFSHFYTVGLLSSLVCITEYISLKFFNQPLIITTLLRYFDIDSGSNHLTQEQCIIGFSLMTLHLARRVYESFYVEKPSNQATMHAFHYLVGISFYGAMVLGTWLEGASSFGVWTMQINKTQSVNLIVTTIAISLFAYASIHQYRCHIILASLRSSNNQQKQNEYKIPRGDWFEYIITPHYFADILIYTSLNIVYGFRNYIMIFGLLWTITNLSVVANETYCWYEKHFTKEKLQSCFPYGRWKIIPWCF